MDTDDRMYGPPEDDNVAELGAEIYEEHIRPQFEESHRNQYVAIHVDSGDFAVDRTSSAAARELRKTHPVDGRVYLRKISDEPEYMLAARLFGAGVGAGLKR